MKVALPSLALAAIILAASAARAEEYPAFSQSYWEEEHGAAKVVAYCTHPVLSGPAVGNISRSSLDELVVTNTIPLRPDAVACGKIRQLSIGELLAETMRRISNEESVSSLFVD